MIGDIKTTPYEDGNKLLQVSHLREQIEVTIINKGVNGSFETHVRLGVDQMGDMLKTLNEWHGQIIEGDKK